MKKMSIFMFICVDNLEPNFESNECTFVFIEIWQPVLIIDINRKRENG